MNSTRIVSATLALLLSAASLASSFEPTLKIGDLAPPLQPKTWLKGEPITKFEPGRVYIVEFWSTKCHACMEMMPELSALQKKYADRLSVIGVNAWEWEGDATEATVEKFVKKQGARMDYTVAMDDPQKRNVFESWMTATGTYALPTTIIVDGRGRMVWVNAYSYGDQEFTAVLEQVLAGKSNLAAAQKLQDKISQKNAEVKAQVASYQKKHGL